MPPERSAKRKDPFAGLRLSEPAPPAPLDQRLFGTSPPQSATPSVTPPDPTPPLPTPRPVAKPDQSDQSAPAPRSRPAGRLDTPPSLRRPLDLSREPLHKASYLFTQEELEALEDLKLELRRSLDQKVTKNDLARSAVQLLIEDHAANGTRSYVSRKLRKRIS